LSSKSFGWPPRQRRYVGPVGGLSFDSTTILPFTPQIGRAIPAFQASAVEDLNPSDVVVEVDRIGFDIATPGSLSERAGRHQQSD
jgi:hypothetical protein